jgi:hypothetical protein
MHKRNIYFITKKAKATNEEVLPSLPTCHEHLRASTRLKHDFRCPLSLADVVFHCLRKIIYVGQTDRVNRWPFE